MTVRRVDLEYPPGTSSTVRMNQFASDYSAVPLNPSIVVRICFSIQESINIFFKIKESISLRIKFRGYQ